MFGNRKLDKIFIVLYIVSSILQAIVLIADLSSYNISIFIKNTLIILLMVKVYRLEYLED